MNWDKKLLRKSNVVLVGRGKKITSGVDTGRDAIVIGVVKKLPLELLRKRDIVPRKIKGKETDIVEVGEIRLLDADKERTDKWRPAPGGVSIGHKDITAGTLGMTVKKNGEKYILSNNHVLAACNKGQIGDAILQPGPYDITTEMGDCEIGKLAEFVPINMWMSSFCPAANFIAKIFNFTAKAFGRRTRLFPMADNDNLVDCALAKPNNAKNILSSILEVGLPKEVIGPEVGMKIKKSGRTTGLTHGEITAVDATVNVGMNGETAIFTDQFVMGPVSEGGDSGSIILTEDNMVVGLLFAGSNTTTIANRFSNVTQKLGLDKSYKEAIQWT